MATKYECDLCGRNIETYAKIGTVEFKWRFDLGDELRGDFCSTKHEVCDSCRRHLQEIAEKLKDPKYRGEQGIL